MSKDIFKNLIEAVVALSADEVVKLLDSKREPIADAARTLHLDHGFTLNWLRAHTAQDILGACVAANRNHGVCVGSIEGGMRCIVSCPTASLWGPAYPDRERTADSARYLWENQVSGDLGSMLRCQTPAYIRESAVGRQANLCKEVADAALYLWLNSGTHQPFYTDRPAEAIIRAYIDRMEVRKGSRKMFGVLNIEGYGEHGQRVKIQGVPIFEAFVINLESELIKQSAKAYGIASVTGASFSSGPGIYY